MDNESYYQGKEFKDAGYKGLIPEYYPTEYQRYIREEADLLKPLTEGKVVLEAGVGIGRLIPILAPGAKEFVGVDNADQMLLEAHMKADSIPNVRLVKEDLERLSEIFSAKYFDVSLCVWNTLGNTEDEVAVLAELRELTKESVIVTVHLKGALKARKDWYKAVGIKMDTIDEKNEIFYNTSAGLRSKAYSLEEMTDLARKAGLDVVDHKELAGVVLWAELKPIEA